MNMIISESEKKRILNMYGLITEKFSEETCGLDKITADNFWKKIEDCDIDLESTQHEFNYDPKDYRNKFWELVGTNQNEIVSQFEKAKQFYKNYYSSPEGITKLKNIISKRIDYKDKKLDKFTSKVIDEINGYIKPIKLRFFWSDPMNKEGDLNPSMELYEPLGIIHVYLKNLFKNMKQEYNLYDIFLHEIGHSITNAAVNKYLEDSDVISDKLPGPKGDEPIQVQYSMDPEENIVNIRNLRGHFNLSPNETPESFYKKISDSFTNGNIKTSQGYTTKFDNNIMTITKGDNVSWDDKSTALKFFSKNNQYIDSMRRIFRRLMEIDPENQNVATIDLRDLYDLDNRIVGATTPQSNVA